MLLFSTMFVIVNIFFSPFAPSLSVGSSFVVRPSSLVYFSAWNFTQGFSFLFFLFIHSKWFVCLLCFPSIFHNSWNTLRFFYRVCLLFFTFFSSSWWLRLIQSSSYIKPRLSACDIYRSLIFTFCRRRCCQKRVRFSIRKETVFRVQRVVNSFNWTMPSILLFYIRFFFCWAVVVGISLRKVVNNEAKQERFFHSWLQNQKQFSFHHHLHIIHLLCDNRIIFHHKHFTIFHPKLAVSWLCEYDIEREKILVKISRLRRGECWGWEWV